MYVPADGRYEHLEYRRCGASGLQLPPISLGLWQNFGDDRPLATSRAILRRAFDLGITHFDLANNYGPPYGSAETNFGRIFAEDFSSLRHELVISTKAGYDMWPGPYGDHGSRKYLLDSLDESLQRMRLDHVDIFYSHRFDPDTPLEETMGALDTAVRSGKARYVGISSYSPERTLEAAAILRRMGTPVLIHQPSYSMFNRWIEPELLELLEREGIGCIGFSPLAQGLLTDKYLDGIPEDSRVRRGVALSSQGLITRGPTSSAFARSTRSPHGRGQSLAQMAIAWVLRDNRVTSALVGASSVAQLQDHRRRTGATPDFSGDELAEIDRYAIDGSDQHLGLVQRRVEIGRRRARVGEPAAVAPASRGCPHASPGARKRWGCPRVSGAPASGGVPAHVSATAVGRQRPWQPARPRQPACAPPDRVRPRPARPAPDSVIYRRLLHPQRGQTDFEDAWCPETPVAPGRAGARGDISRRLVGVRRGLREPGRAQAAPGDGAREVRVLWRRRTRGAWRRRTRRPLETAHAGPLETAHAGPGDMRTRGPETPHVGPGDAAGEVWRGCTRRVERDAWRPRRAAPGRRETPENAWWLRRSPSRPLPGPLPRPRCPGPLPRGRALNAWWSPNRRA